MSSLSIRILNRFLRKPYGISAYRSVTGIAVKEDINAEVLNNFNRDIKNGGVVPVFRRTLLFPTRVALQDELGIYTYAGLYQAAAVLSSEISAQLVGQTECTIAYMCNNDASHVIVQWAIWMTGNIAVPLTPLHPPEMLKYFLGDSLASLVVCTQEYEKVLRPITLEISKPLLITGRDKEITAQLYQPNSTFLKPKAEDTLPDVGKSNEWYGNSDALIIYTSGTTSKPKGVVWSHSMLQTQISALHTAWQYSCHDVVLHTLPLHHVHGQLNSMLASLAAGARLRMLGTFEPHAVWARLLGLGEREEARASVFHGVPAHYSRLVHAHERMLAGARTSEYVRATLPARMRLMCCGSAPLPASLFLKWEEISGLRLLERFGMSETGMALSNPYRPTEGRTVGAVGLPLPGVSARIAAAAEDSDILEPLVTVEAEMPQTQISTDRLGLPSTKDFLVEPEGYQWGLPVVNRHKESDDDIYEGELLIKGPAVFTKYWKRDVQEFTADGWFRTGDTATYSDGIFRILGRTSIDIIKTSGYKVSALQVESALLDHPNISDVAVLGIDDNNYGEIVACVVVLQEDTEIDIEELREFAGTKLALYQLPRTMVVVKEIPKNAMGKTEKKEIKKLFGEQLVLKQ